MDYTKPSRAIHICQSPDCGCGITRRDFLRLSALTAASVAAPLLSAGDALVQAGGTDQPVKIGYLPITDATPLLQSRTGCLESGVFRCSAYMGG